MDEANLVLTESEANYIHHMGMTYLQTHARLRVLSERIQKGKVPLRSCFTLLPKHHHLLHALNDTRSTRININGYALLSAESWVGMVGKIARMLGYLFIRGW